MHVSAGLYCFERGGHREGSIVGQIGLDDCAKRDSAVVWPHKRSCSGIVQSRVKVRSVAKAIMIASHSLVSFLSTTASDCHAASYQSPLSEVGQGRVSATVYVESKHIGACEVDCHIGTTHCNGQC
jgi:hypothetical protein